MISRRFIKSSIIYTIAGTLPTASGLILLPFFVHNLSTAKLGVFSIYTAFALFVQIAVSFSFDTSVYVHYHEYKNDSLKLRQFVFSSFVLILVNTLVLGGLLVVIGDVIFSVIFKDSSISFFPYGILAWVTGLGQGIVKVHSSLLQTQQRPDVFFISNLTSFFLSVVFTIAGFHFFPGSLISPILGRLLAAVLVGGWALIRVITVYGTQFNLPLVKQTFSFNFYQTIYQVLQWSMNYFDRIMMSFFLPLSLVGVYSFVFNCLVIIEFLLNGLHNSFFPKIVGQVIAQTSKESTQEINQYYYGMSAVAIVLVSGSILVLPVLIDLLVAKNEYKQAIPYIAFACIPYLFRSLRLYFGIPYGALKYTKSLPIIYSIVSLVKAIALSVLAQFFGLYGVIYAAIIAVVVEIVLIYVDGRTRFRFHFNSFKLLMPSLVLAVTIIVCEPLVKSEYVTIIHLTYFLLSLGLLFFVFRKELVLINPLKIINK